MGSKSLISGRERGEEKEKNSITLVKQKKKNLCFSVWNETAFSETSEINKSSSWFNLGKAKVSHFSFQKKPQSLIYLWEKVGAGLKANWCLKLEFQISLLVSSKRDSFEKPWAFGTSVWLTAHWPWAERRMMYGYCNQQHFMSQHPNPASESPVKALLSHKSAHSHRELAASSWLALCCFSCEISDTSKSIPKLP